MSQWNGRDGATYRARRALDQLNQRGIDLPAAVVDAAAVRDRIDTRRPTQPDPQALQAAYRDEVDQADIDALVAADLAFSRLQPAHNQAFIDSALQILTAIRDNQDVLHPQLEALADKAIEHLGAAADLDTVDVTAHVRAGDHKAARLVAELDAVAAELDELYQIRDLFLTPGGPEGMRVGGVDASRWRNPAQPGRGTSLAEGFLDGLHRGNTLWYPTAAQAVEAAQPVHDAQGRKAEHDSEIRAQQGRLVAFTG